MFKGTSELFQAQSNIQTLADIDQIIIDNYQEKRNQQTIHNKSKAKEFPSDCRKHQKASRHNLLKLIQNLFKFSLETAIFYPGQ